MASITPPSKKTADNPFVRAWRWWFTPRSDNPAVSFREQALRIFLLLITVLRPLGIWSEYFKPGAATSLPPPLTPWVVILLFVVPVGLSYFALYKKKVDLATWAFIFHWAATDLISLATDGWWRPGLQISLLLQIGLAGLLLPTKGIFPFTLAQAASVYAVSAWLTGSWYQIPRLEGGEPLTTVQTAFTTLLFQELFFTLIIWYLRAQVDRRLRELEERVAERTRDLKMAGQVARRITRVLDLDELLPELVERTRAGFDLYCVSLFLHHPQKRQLRLAAATGEVGEKIKTQKMGFLLDAYPSLVAQAGRERSAITVNDVSKSDAYIANSSLPKTRAELALPMVVGDDLIGVLDLQSEKVGRFEQADIEIMTTLAEQTAIAVRNAQLYQLQVQAAEELRKVDQIKSQFFSNMSHELRTPLNAILNFNEMILLGVPDPVSAAQQDMLNKSLHSARHLLQLINDVLDISKIQSGMLTLLVEENIDLHEEIEKAQAIIEPLLADKPIHLVLDIDPRLPPMHGDRQRIRQVLINLLSNAVKFTKEGAVTLNVRGQDSQVLIAVIDTGPGINPEMQKLIFEPFVQTETGIQHAASSGLGLPISKSLVEAHGGQLWVESELGKGTVFYVLFPTRLEKGQQVKEIVHNSQGQSEGAERLYRQADQH